MLLGEPSGWLIDIDLDHRRAIELADKFLPPTPAIFGRTSKPRSHRLYRVTGPVATRRIRSRSAGTIIELRSTGAQTVFPPSVHESGEPIEWVDPEAVPTEVDPIVLLEAVVAIGNAVKVELGEKAAPKPKRQKLQPNGTTVPANHPDERINACLATMLRMRTTDQKDGSHRLFAAACRAVEHDLTDAQAIECVRAYAKHRPFPTEWTDEEILDRVRDAEKKCVRDAESRRAQRPKIVLGTDEDRVIAEAIEALRADPGLYRRGTSLVRVIRDLSVVQSVERPRGAPIITAVPAANLRERLVACAQLVSIVQTDAGSSEQDCHPPQWLIPGIAARGEWPGIRPLTAVSDAPVLRADGSIWQTPGYDAKTGVLYEPFGEVPFISDEINEDDAVAAVDVLQEVVCDFRFASEEHFSAWMAGLLTPLARYAFVGPAPLFLIDANVPGAGKGLLVQLISGIVAGRPMAVSGYSHDPEEMRKKITTIAIAGDRMVLLDNLEGSFGDEHLDRALTGDRWNDRLLCRNEQIDLPLSTTWFATGNNVAVQGDTLRRVLPIRLDVLLERPEERRDFKHPRILQWVGQARGRLLAATLTILAAYIRSGCPKADLPPYGSFEGWSDLVRHALVWAGLPDPCLTRQHLTASSMDSIDALRQLHEAWERFDPQKRGWRVTELLAAVYPSGCTPEPLPDEALAMRTALEAFAGIENGKTPGAPALGRRLAAARSRVVDGRYLAPDPNAPKRLAMLWRLYQVERA